MSGKLCPNYYDTDNLFNSYYNEDTSKKCGPVYEFVQGGKLEFGQSRNNTATIDTDAYEIQRRIHNDSQFGFDAATGGGNFGNIRAGIGKQTIPINYGNCTFDTLNNTSVYRNTAAPPGNFINPSSTRSFGSAPARAALSNLKRRECFGAPNKNGIYPNNYAFTSAPDMPMPSSATCSNNGEIPAASGNSNPKSMDNFVTKVGDTVLDVITFGNKETKEKFCLCSNNFKKDFGAAIVALAIFLLFYLFLILCRALHWMNRARRGYGWRAFCDSWREIFNIFTSLENVDPEIVA